MWDPEPLTNTADVELTAWMSELREETPEEAAYHTELEADQRRAATRSLSSSPHEWGTRLDAEHYFCTSCWLNGDEHGAHPDAMPPCDPPSRVPNWA